MTRAERRELKKKQAAEKAKKAGGEDEDDDEDLINPNHVTKKMNISDLNAPRELTRRERYCSPMCETRQFAHIYNREAKEKKEAQDRYWKVCAMLHCDPGPRPMHHSFMFKARPSRRRPILHV